MDDHVAGVDQHHLFGGVADEEVVAPARMGGCSVVDVHVVNVGGDLHGSPRKGVRILLKHSQQRWYTETRV